MYKILVVDDECLSNLVFQAILEDEGYEVKCVSTVEAALDSGPAFQPDFLIIDFLLKSDVDGVDVAKALQKELPDLRIIFMTGMSVELIQKSAIGLKYEAIEIKPIDHNRILNLLKRPKPAASEKNELHGSPA